MKLVIGQDATGQQKQGLVELYTSMLEWEMEFKINSAPHSMVVQSYRGRGRQNSVSSYTVTSRPPRATQYL